MGDTLGDVLIGFRRAGFIPGRFGMATVLAVVSCASFPTWAQSAVEWQQAGGSFQSTPTLKGIVAQGYDAPVAAAPAGELRSGFLVHPLLVNGGPFVVSPLDSLVLAEGFASFSIDLDTVFGDLEGARLDYAAEGGTPVADVTISGSSLRFASLPGGAGHADVVVTASDGVLSARDTLHVSVRRTTSIAPHSRRVASRSGEISAKVVRVLASAAPGDGAGRLGTDRSICGDTAKCLSLDVLLPGPGELDVRIFDRQGTPVIAWQGGISRAEFDALRPAADGRVGVRLDWNLRSESGRAVGSGVYLWKVEAVALDGTKLETIKRMGVKQ